jgi:hypothetical protein
MGFEGGQPRELPDEGEPSPATSGESLDTSELSHGIQALARSSNDPGAPPTTTLSPFESAGGREGEGTRETNSLLDIYSGNLPLQESAQPDSGVSEFARIRDNADQLAVGLTEVRTTLQPDDVVDPSHVTLLADQVAFLQEYVATVAAKEAEQDAFLQTLAQDVTALRTGVTNLSQSGRPVTRTAFETIGRGVLFATVGAIIGGALGGPAIALVLHEPVSGKVIEGVISGVLGAAAAEVAGLVDPFGQDNRQEGGQSTIDDSNRIDSIGNLQATVAATNEAVAAARAAAEAHRRQSVQRQDDYSSHRDGREDYAHGDSFGG